MTAQTQPLPREGSRDSILTNPQVRSAVVQIVLIAAIAAFTWWIIDNTAENMARAKIASGFGFLNTQTDFQIGQKLIDHSPSSSNSRALTVAILNTLLVAVCGIVLATIVGFIAGIARLSKNVVIRGLATVYVETFRNIPPLLVLLFWHFGVLTLLPSPQKDPITNLVPTPVSGIAFTNRGLQTSAVVFEPMAWLTLAVFIVGLVGVWWLSRVNRKHQMLTGERRGLLFPALGLLVALPLAMFLLSGSPATLDPLRGTRFGLTGGAVIPPEFMSLFLALSIYTGAFIAEIVRAGILAVSKGQSEAAMAVGMRRTQILRLVVVPQAFRVIIPPLTSQYLNLTKNTSLGFAVGYAELYSIGSTIANQRGQTVEIVAILIAAYLSISLLSSFLMNMFNARMALVER